jgi:hypothetical protein
VVLFAAAIAVAGAGCGRGPRVDRFAVEVAAQHREADRRLDAGDVEGARAALLALVEARSSRAPAARGDRLALQDTYFRLAELALAGHDARGALAYADAGLAYGDAPHLFVANLFVVRGAAREALGEPRAAVEDYHRALVMNEALLQQATGAP